MRGERTRKTVARADNPFSTASFFAGLTFDRNRTRIWRGTAGAETCAIAGWRGFSRTAGAREASATTHQQTSHRPALAKLGMSPPMTDARTGSGCPLAGRGVRPANNSRKWEKPHHIKTTRKAGLKPNKSFNFRYGQN